MRPEIVAVRKIGSSVYKIHDILGIFMYNNSHLTLISVKRASGLKIYV